MVGYEWTNEFWAKDANKSSELANSLDSIEHDDGKCPSLSEAVDEAKYVLGTFNEGGHANNDMLTGEWAENEDDKKELVKRAKSEVRALKAFIKKYYGDIYGRKEEIT